jgi:antitoxin component YwqK of YwqJK toxin-antitoxin module
MKITKLLLFFFSMVILSCNTKISKGIEVNAEEKLINDIEVLKKELVLNGNEGNWYYNGELFNGYGVKFHENETLIQKVGFYNGKKEDIAKIWFSNGVLKVESLYNQNQLTGSYKAWWDNGVLASEAIYEKGKLQGVEKKWFKNGELAKLRNLDGGMEKGLQQAWLKNGKMYVNYEAKNGRIFGMRRANSCYKLEDEVVITK